MKLRKSRWDGRKRTHAVRRVLCVFFRRLGRPPKQRRAPRRAFWGKIWGSGGRGDLPFSTVQSDPQVRGYSKWDCSVLGTKVCTRVNTVQSDPQVRGYSKWNCTVLKVLKHKGNGEAPLTIPLGVPSSVFSPHRDLGMGWSVACVKAGTVLVVFPAPRPPDRPLEQRTGESFAFWGKSSASRVG